MRFQIHHVNPESPSFADVVACEIESFDNPLQSIFRFFYPIFGNESESEKYLALDNLVQLQRQWARDDPDTVWTKVIDTESDNQVAAGLLVKIHKTNPFDSPKIKDESAVWYPPGGQREYIDECLRIFNAPREKFMARPHIYFYIGFIEASYRQLGLIDMLIGEKCRRADELGLECYLEAVAARGVAIFMRQGFIPFREVAIEPKRENADDEWKEMERKMQPLSFWPMWRPPYGRFVPGETRPPWHRVRDEKGSKL
ncbi:hypothetical protein BDW59DRAFT_145071 [Aspergillus cavernicola]|uniref:N-acetyltransferase domain-containing protein n=1 Tax=Aspergillus cavernicola TaxID=176166 RepID=A0ABR4IG18_9EURO